MDANKNSERGAFEHWCKTHCGLDDRDLHQTVGGAYRSGYVDDMWDGWVARAALQAAPAAEGEPDMPPPLKDSQRSHATSLYMSLPHNMDSAEAVITKVAADAYVNGFQAGKHCATPQPAADAPGMAEPVAAAVLDDERKYTQGEMEHYANVFANRRDRSRVTENDREAAEVAWSRRVGSCNTRQASMDKVKEDFMAGFTRGLIQARAASPQPVEHTELALTEIRQAIADYHFALDTRAHGGVAQDRAFNAICKALGMHWKQGDELTRRAFTAAQLASGADHAD